MAVAVSGHVYSGQGTVVGKHLAKRLFGRHICGRMTLRRFLRSSHASVLSALNLRGSATKINLISF
jgi:hypothetical protein